MTSTVPLKQKSVPAAPVMSTLPLTLSGSHPYGQQQMASLKNAIETTQAFTPQTSLKAPSNPTDGMIRLARYPWWPVSGQSADAWVYFDGAGGVWRLMSTAPTSTH